MKSFATRESSLCVHFGSGMCQPNAGQMRKGCCRLENTTLLGGWWLLPCRLRRKCFLLSKGSPWCHCWDPWHRLSERVAGSDVKRENSVRIHSLSDRSPYHSKRQETWGTSVDSQIAIGPNWHFSVLLSLYMELSSLLTAVEQRVWAEYHQDISKGFHFALYWSGSWASSEIF